MHVAHVAAAVCKFNCLLLAFKKIKKKLGFDKKKKVKFSFASVI